MYIQSYVTKIFLITDRLTFYLYLHIYFVSDSFYFHRSLILFLLTCKLFIFFKFYHFFLPLFQFLSFFVDVAQLFWGWFETYFNRNVSSAVAVTGRLPDVLPGRRHGQSPAGAAPARGLPRPERLEVAQDLRGENGAPCRWLLILF